MNKNFALSVSVKGIYLLAILTVSIATIFQPTAFAASQTWDGGSAGTGTAWLTGTNWVGDPTNANVPGSTSTTTNTDVATFSTTGTGAPIGINMNFSGNIYYLGAIDLNAGAARSIGDSSATAGTLTLNGTTVNTVANVILRNGTGNTLTINQLASGNMPVALGNATVNNVLIEGAGNVAISSNISGSSLKLGVLGAGTGDLVLTGTNTFTGGIDISGSGKLRLSGAGSLPTTGNMTIGGDGRLRFATAATYGSNTQSISITPNGTTNPAMDLQTSNIAVILNHNLVLNADSRIESNGASGSLTLAGNLSGAGALFKQAAGNLILSGTGNSATGGTNIGNGTVTVNTGSSLGTGPLTLFQTSTNNTALTLNNTAQTVGSLSSNFTAVTGTQTQIITLNGTTLTINQTTDSTYGTGAVSTLTSTITGSGGIAKTGSASLTLSGVNDYSGTTSVSSGSLVVTGSLTATSSVSVSGGFLRGSGDGATTGLISSPVTVTGTGVIWPGTSTTNVSVGSGEVLRINAPTSLSIGTGKINIAMNTTNSQKLILATTNVCNLRNCTLSLGVAAGSYTSKSYDVIDGLTDNTLLIPINPANILFPTQLNGGTIVVEYYNTTGGPISSGTARFVRVTINGANVTPVKVDSFTATPQAGGALLAWNTVSEFQNAGFNLYRRALGSDEWVRANPALIAGRVTAADELKYSFFDWAQPGMYDYKLESIALDGTAETYASFCNASIDWNTELNAADASSESFSGVALAQSLATSTSQTLVSQRAFADSKSSGELLTPAIKEFKPVAAANREQKSDISHASAPVFAAVRWFSGTSTTAVSNSIAAKVTYSQPGLMLVPNSALPTGFDATKLSIQREGRNVNALAQTADGLLLYGPGYQDAYTNKDAFFLRQSTSATRVAPTGVASDLFASSQSPSVSNPASVTKSFHDTYFDYDFRPFSFEPWFSKQYLTSGSTQNFTIETPAAINSASTLTVTFWSLSDATGTMLVSVNGTQLGQASWNGGGKMIQLSFAMQPGVLLSGSNQVSLTTPSTTDGTTQVSFLHDLKVDYTRALDASQPFEIKTTASAPATYELYNLKEATVYVVDARFEGSAALVPVSTKKQSDGSYNARFVATPGGSGRYLVTPASQVNKPIAVTLRQVKPLAQKLSYLAVGPNVFNAATQPLLMAHGREGIRSAFVDQEQLFDYYNYGRFGPDGIRNAVRSTAPQYLLLVGRTTYNYLNYGGTNVDPLCPAYLVSTTFWAQSTSDSLFGDLGHGYPEVSVGRLPINNVTELSAAVGRIMSYKGVSGSEARVHSVADVTDPAVGDFSAISESIHSQLKNVTWQQNYLGVTSATSPEVNAAMTDAANGGADLLLYVGHGNAVKLGAGSPQILDTTSVQNWKGNVVLLQGTCTANWMAKDENDYRSIAIQSMIQPQGGISASIATSTYMNPSVAGEFMTQLMKSALNGNGRWGGALQSAQRWAFQKSQQSGSYYTDLYKTEQLFGDPAMRVFAVPTNNPARTSAAGTF